MNKLSYFNIRRKKTNRQQKNLIGGSLLLKHQKNKRGGGEDDEEIWTDNEWISNWIIALSMCMKYEKVECAQTLMDFMHNHAMESWAGDAEGPEVFKRDLQKILFWLDPEDANSSEAAAPGRDDVLTRIPDDEHKQKLAEFMKMAAAQAEKREARRQADAAAADHAKQLSEANAKLESADALRAQVDGESDVPVLAGPEEAAKREADAQVEKEAETRRTTFKAQLAEAGAAAVLNEPWRERRVSAAFTFKMAYCAPKSARVRAEIEALRAKIEKKTSEKKAFAEQKKFREAAAARDEIEALEKEVVSKGNCSKKDETACLADNACDWGEDDFAGAGEKYISFEAGDNLIVTDTSEGEWWKGYVEGKPENEGYFPSSYVHESEDETQGGGGKLVELFQRKYKQSQQSQDLMQNLKETIIVFANIYHQTFLAKNEGKTWTEAEENCERDGDCAKWQRVKGYVDDFFEILKKELDRRGEAEGEAEGKDGFMRLFEQWQNQN